MEAQSDQKGSHPPAFRDEPTARHAERAEKQTVTQHVMVFAPPTGWSGGTTCHKIRDYTEPIRIGNYASDCHRGALTRF